MVIIFHIVTVFTAFDQINTALVSIRDFKKIYSIQFNSRLFV